jgi:hypothetical protein
MTMLTDYIVHCPHADCGWQGPLFPKGNRLDFQPAIPRCRVVHFECPRCQHEWHAQVVGDDVKPLPLEVVVAS